ncbi:MAG: isoprenylcysteine carboxylmethyltransferase family protein [Spirochaetia bacterium]|jgi:protein-S-isoprenylcysteine O-methyltransferase Ste14|nr:isoprenylcysteine carboxylmethyltransferase family protein [Spirochaetia bacterium]
MVFLMNTRKPKTQRALSRYLAKQLFFLILVSSTLFLFAQDTSWIMAWLFVASLLIIMLANLLAMDRCLLAERSKLQEGTKRWDIALSTFVAIVGPFFVWITAALDRRYRWGAAVPPLVSGIGLLVFLLASFFATWAMHTNQFFSATVRIQADRGQQVIDNGPYRLVRHPGYLGGIIGILATALALQSSVALLPALLVSVGFVVRTAFEDRTLMQELEGYCSYAQQVKYRLVKFVW